MTSEKRRVSPKGFWWLAVLLAVAAVALLILLPWPRKPRVETPEKAVLVRLVDIAPRPYTEMLELPGRIEPAAEVVLSTEKPGAIRAVRVDRGDRVSAGQVVAELDDRFWAAVRDRAAIEDREAAKELARWDELRAAGAVSGSEYDAVKTRRDLAAIGLREAALHVEKCTIVSPVDGVVEDRYAEPGEYALEGKAVLKLVTMNPVKAVFNLPERHAFALRPGDDVHLSLGAGVPAACTGRVAFVAEQAPADSNAFRVEADVPNPDGALKAGMIAQVALQTRTLPEAIVVPLGAILPRRGEHVVFLAEAKDDLLISVRRVVTIDAIRGNDAVLSAGLAPGDRLIVEGHRTLTDGMPVTDSAGAAAAEETPAP